MLVLPLVKYLTSSGAGSRRQMTDAIKKGRVLVNGERVESFFHPVNTETDRVIIDNKPVIVAAKPRTYLMLNKPKGIVSTTGDDRGNTTVLDILPKKFRGLRLYPVGRLDKDSTGLILLTDDGELTNRLTHPRYEREKEYLVQVEGLLKADEKSKLKKGLKLAEGFTHEARLSTVNIPPFNYSVIIHEGKKRQIRRMFAVLGHRVLTLKRIRMSNLKLGSLAEGQVRELTQAELKSLIN